VPAVAEPGVGVECRAGVSLVKVTVCTEFSCRNRASAVFPRGPNRAVSTIPVSSLVGAPIRVTGEAASSWMRRSYRGSLPMTARMAEESMTAYLVIIGDLRSGGQDGFAQGGAGGASVQVELGCQSALIPARRCSGMEARDPCRSVTKIRNRAVLVAFLGCGEGAGRNSGARRPGRPGRR